MLLLGYLGYGSWNVARDLGVRDGLRCRWALGCREHSSVCVNIDCNGDGLVILIARNGLAIRSLEVSTGSLKCKWIIRKFHV